MLLQINNHNHKRPEDRLSVELSFFSLWQIWILLLQGSQITLLLSVLWVYVFFYLCVEGIQILFESMKYVHYMKCVQKNRVTVYRLVCLCSRVNACAAKGCKHQATVIESSFEPLSLDIR